MAYQIPQQLEYREKIMFGLDFKQLVYAFIFGLVALAISKIISNYYAAFILASIPVLLGLGFMFFNLDERLKDYYAYLKHRKVYGSELDRFFEIQDVKDHAVITKNKRLAVIKVQPINFSIKAKGEQEAVIESFQKFLNSIDFPVHILMSTETLELNSYLKSLKERLANEQFRELFKNYEKHLHKTISNNKIMNRVFYLIIPEQGNLEIQVDVCIERLENLNLKVERLSNEHLKKLYLKGWNPEHIINNPDYLKTDDKYIRVIYAHGYPRTVEPGFLDKIVSSLGDFDLSLHIKPFPIETMLIGLNKELQKQRADLFSMQAKEIINPSLEIQYQDTRQILEELQKGKEKLFNISLYISCKANDLNELNRLTRKVEAELNSLMIIPKIAKYRMLQGYKSTIPLALDELDINRNITTKALSAFFPFTSQFSQVDEQGVWLGLNKNKIPIIRDIFSLSNPNGLVLAQSGGGKSYFCKLLISRYLLNGTKVMVIDPQGEYRELVKYFKGQRIDLSRNSKTFINPLDLMGHDYIEKRLSLMDLVQVMLGELSEPQKAFIDRAITKAYEKKGISENPDSWQNEPPILADVLVELNSMDKRATQLEKTTIRSLINRLSMYVDGVFSFLNQHTNINFDNRFVCFDIGNLPKQVKPVMMFLVLDYVYMKMKSDIERKILLIDEAWSLLSRTEDASYIFEIVKTCRKFNLGLLLINQEVEGLLNSEAGKSVLANSAYTLLMRQRPAVIKDICETFHLSNSERTHLLTANVGEGILIMEDDHTEIKVIASDEEHKIITTNADELIKSAKESKTKASESQKQYTTKKKPKIAESKKPKKVKSVNVMLPKKVSINVDEFKGFYRHKDLNLDEIKYLLAKKYQVIDKYSIVSGRREKFLIKPRFNESINHCFAIWDLAEYLEKKGFVVRKFTTARPDLVFRIGTKKVAVEVETGTTYEKAKKQLQQKVMQLNKDYDYWFFVVTVRNYVSRYKGLGRVVDYRFMKKRVDGIIKNLQKADNAK